MTHKYSRRTVTALLGAAPLLGAGVPAHAQLSDGGGAQAPGQAVRDLAIEAYIFGYPLVTMEMTRRVMTNVAKLEGLRGPMGQFANAREYPTAAFKDVTAPNADTLYSSAWLDLSKEPYILHVPDEHGRYYLMPMLNAWTDVFADPGTRTTGTGAGGFRHRRSGLARRTASRSRGASLEHQPGLDHRAHLLHRHAGGLRGRACDPGPSTSSCRSAPRASRTRRRPGRSIPAST